MEYIQNLLKNNASFVEEQLQKDPEFFIKSSQGQQPKLLWIGCADSFVPPNEITKTNPGEIFVHRNIANLVVQTDMNMLSVLQYAVEVLEVDHVVVCGHYGCGGVKAAMGNHQYGLIDNWLRQIKDTQNYYWQQLSKLDEDDRFDRLVELSVIEQVYNLGKTNIVQNAWAKRKQPWIHGWVYDIRSGFIKTQTSMINNEETLKEVCKFEMGLIGN
jgi:carbonic anhydrase